MRFFVVFGLCACGLAVAADVPASPAVDQAQREISRLKDLVAAGAVAPARLQDAEQALDDARDQAILERTLYGRMTVQDMTEQQAQEMMAAAQRRFDRQKQKIDRQQNLVDQGVMARVEMEPAQQELDTRKLALDLAHSRANLLTELADMARHEQMELADTDVQLPSSNHVMEHFGGDGAFTPSELKQVETAYAKAFKKPLPISANGETAVHRALGFDHRGRVDVALNPDQREGVWLRTYLAKNDIPYYAFRAAVPGKATGAHIHIGPGSTRLHAAD